MSIKSLNTNFSKFLTQVFLRIRIIKYPTYNCLLLLLLNMPTFNKSNRAITVLLLASMMLSTILSAKSIYLEDIDLPKGTTVKGKGTLIANYPAGNRWFLDEEPIENDIGALLTISEPGLFGLEVSVKDSQLSAPLDLVTDVSDLEATTEFVVFP